MDGNIFASRHDNVSQQTGIKYISVWSLKSMAAIKVVGELWKQPDLKGDLREHASLFGSHAGFYDDSSSSFFRMEVKVMEKLALLILPLQLREITFNMIRPVGLEILKWLHPFSRDHRGLYYLGYENFISLTMSGTIDKIKTLESCLDLIVVKNVYERACIYCSENHITELWRRLSEDTQKYLLNRYYRNYSLHLIAYWTCFLSSELSKLFSIIKPSDHYNIYKINHSIYKNMFKLSIWEGNVLAVKYFWHKLTRNEMNKCIIKYTQWIVLKMKKHATIYANYQGSNEYTDIMCFLLSQMNNEEQREIFSKYSKVILRALFTDWPWQKYFLPTIRVMWDYLEEGVYLDILLKFSKEIKEGRTTQKLLRNLLSDSPMHLRKCFVQKVNLGATVLRKLLQIEDTKTIMQILNYASTKEKKLLFYAIFEESDEIYKLMYTGKFYLLSMLIGETWSMKHEIDYFKRSLVQKHGNNLCHSWICNDCWQTPEKFLAWAFSTQNQIITFKRQTLDRVNITAALVRLGDYELVDKFMIWCFNSERGINQFKKKLVYGELKLSGRILGILELLCDCDWDVYEKLIKWCLKSDKDVREFKLYSLQYDRMESIVCCVIGSEYNFKFAETFLRWCFDSSEGGREVKQFKAKFCVSEVGLKIIGNLVKNPDSKCNNWELVKELSKWLHPLEKSVVTKMKREFENHSQYYYGNQQSEQGCSFESKKQALFHLLDSFAQDIDESSNESCSSNEDRDVASLFGETIEGSDDSSCSINTAVADTLFNIMDISTDTDN